MWSWDGRSSQHRSPGRGTGINRVRVPELRIRDERAHSSRWRPIAELFVFDTGRFRAVSQAARQSVFISPAVLKAWVMTARMSTAEDGGAPGGTGGPTGPTGLWSIVIAVGGRFRTGWLSFAAALRGACARPQNFAMR